MLFYLYQVYQRADLNKMLMSMSVGPYCDLNQDVDSKDYKHGAVVSLEMDENERECKLHIYLFTNFAGLFKSIGKTKSPCTNFSFILKLIVVQCTSTMEQIPGMLQKIISECLTFQEMNTIMLPQN